MTSYSAQYVAAIVVGIIGVIAGVLAGVGYVGPHPSWLTSDVSATAAIVAAICTGIEAFLPQVTRTPATRETGYLKASQGILPMDLEKKYPSATRKPFHPV